MGMRQRSFSAGLFILGGFVLIFLLGACSRATPSPTPTPIPSATPSPQPVPTRTPTLPPPASEANPLILGVLSETNDAKAAAAAEEIARQISRITNYQVQARVYTTQKAILADLQAAKVHIVFLQPFTYLWARQKELVRPLLLTNHFGVYQYGAAIYANVASKFTIYFDPAKGQNTTDPATALKQFDGKRPCWVDPTSASGYVVPLGMLADKKVKVLDGVITQSHTSIIRSLYITGICDFGAAFTTTGDPRTSSAVKQDLTDVMNRVVLIYQIDPVIPNLNISVHNSLPREMRDDLTFALQSIIHADKGKALFTDANNYEINDLKPVDDSVYETLRSYQALSGVSLETLIGK
jgi:phosphonate transport system substrate-binding protein